jgi:hypothetical protein
MVALGTGARSVPSMSVAPVKALAGELCPASGADARRTSRATVVLIIGMGRNGLEG